MLRRLRHNLIAILGPTLFIIIAWHLVALLITHWRGIPFPTPWLTLSRLATLLAGHPLAEHSIYEHIGVSLLRWFNAFIVAAISGILFGICSARWSWLRQLTAPIPQLLLLIPGLAWIPVAILVFGIGEGATRFMIAVTAFAPIALATVNGIREVDISFTRAARMLGAGDWALFFQVLIPAALPALIGGLRIGLGNSWRVLVAAEMVVGTGSGLGFSIIESRWTLDYPSALACIVIICLIGLLFEHGLFRTLERRTLERWSLGKTV